MTKRERIYNRYGGCCAYCGAPIPISEMQVDHLVPRWHNLTDEQCRRYGIQRGSDDEDNLMPSCRACNYYKQTYSLKDFRTRLQGLTANCVKSYDVRLAMRYGMVKLEPWDGLFWFEKMKMQEER